MILTFPVLLSLSNPHFTNKLIVNIIQPKRHNMYIKVAKSHILKLPEDLSNKILLLHKHCPVAVNHSFFLQVGTRPLLVPSINNGLVG